MDPAFADGVNTHPNQPEILQGLIVVEGPVGVGKTTFIAQLKSELTQAGARVFVIDEHIPDGLQEHYQTIEKKEADGSVFRFQQNFCFHLFSKWAEKLKTLAATASRQYDFVICDRYYASTRAFIELHYADGKLTKEEREKLLGYLNLLLSLCPVYPEFYIFLDDDQEECWKRIVHRATALESRGGDIARARAAEVGTGATYMARVNEFIRRHNFRPYLGAPPAYDFSKLDKESKPFICPVQHLVKAAMHVKCLDVTQVKQGTTKGVIAPMGNEINLSEALLKTHGILISQRQHLLEDVILTGASGLPASEVLSLKKLISDPDEKE